MKKAYFSAYSFEAVPHPTQSNVYRLKLINGYPLESKMHAEILRINSWNKIETNLNQPMISIYPVLEDDVHYQPEMRFYRQVGNQLFGEDLETNRAVCCTIYGPEDENGICIPQCIELQVSKVKFNNINIFNYPTNHYHEWEAALCTKWNLTHLPVVTIDASVQNLAS
jgi:hypothetical protein